LLQRLEPYAGNYEFSADGYSAAVTASYAAGKYFFVFGTASSHARQDDILTDFRTLAGMIVVFAGWILAMPTLGYVVVTFAAVLALAWLLGLEGWLKPLALSAATSLATYILFDRLLYLDLPRGLLG